MDQFQMEHGTATTRRINGLFSTRPYMVTITNLLSGFKLQFRSGADPQWYDYPGATFDGSKPARILDITPPTSFMRIVLDEEPPEAEPVHVSVSDKFVPS